MGRLSSPYFFFNFLNFSYFFWINLNFPELPLFFLNLSYFFLKLICILLNFSYFSELSSLTFLKFSELFLLSLKISKMRWREQALTQFDVWVIYQKPSIINFKEILNGTHNYGILNLNQINKRLQHTVLPQETSLFYVSSYITVTNVSLLHIDDCFWLKCKKAVEVR